MKCADCHRQNRSLFHAAKAYDQALLVCKDLNDFSSIRGLAEKACTLYQQHGSPESGAASLDKGAKILEANYPAEALALYQHALDVSMVRRNGIYRTILPGNQLESRNFLRNPQNVKFPRFK